MPQWSQLCTGLSVHRSNGQERGEGYEINLRCAYSRRMHCYAGLRLRKDWVLVSRYASSAVPHTAALEGVMPLRATC